VISDAARDFHDLLRAMPMGGGPVSIEESRAASENWALATGEPEGVAYESVDADGVQAEWAIPTDADRDRVLLYLHGGGYTLGSIASHRRLVGHLAASAGVRGLSVGYRLAPEDPFPAGLDDAVTACSWLLREGYHSGHIGIGGDSAGGGLALATALALRERGLPAPGGLVLLSPWTDLAGTGASLTDNLGKDLILRRNPGEDADVNIKAYAGDRDLTEPLLSPLYADFAGFAPFIVHVGGDELLLDDSTRLAQRASAAGCDVTIEVWPEMQHVFQIAAGNVPESDSSVAKLGTWLSAHLAG
jgi:epsilon-lactone hydrolase